MWKLISKIVTRLSNASEFPSIGTSLNIVVVYYSVANVLVAVTADIMIVLLLVLCALVVFVIVSGE